MEKIAVMLPNGARNIRISINQKEGKVEIGYEKERRILLSELNFLDEFLPIVEVSKLSKKDEFLKHNPETAKQEKIKNEIIEIIDLGMEDFRAQRMDLTFDANGNICFKKGEKPAVGKSVDYMMSQAVNFLKEKNTKIGTTKRWVGFLAILIKSLINEGYSVEKAWHVVCDDSTEIGNFRKSSNLQNSMEPTGSREIAGWCDLGNTYKVIRDDLTGEILYVGGGCNSFGDDHSLATFKNLYNIFYETQNGTIWLTADV